jgi:hypothetical protein
MRLIYIRQVCTVRVSTTEPTVWGDYVTSFPGIPLRRLCHAKQQQLL